ncbi:MAG: putative DNA repair protein MutK [Colwellia sp.]
MPTALVISAFVPPLITLLPVIGGLFLCFEGFEKVFHKFFQHNDNSSQDQKGAHQKKLLALADENVDLVAFEEKKLKVPCALILYYQQKLLLLL